jgi:hypothetical protein
MRRAQYTAVFDTDAKGAADAWAFVQPFAEVSSRHGAIFTAGAT